MTPRPPPPPDSSAPEPPSGLGRRWSAWLERWGGIAPLLLAEFVVWLGFGGLLPVLPLYFVEQGLDLATLGIVIAAWPAARLVTEPIFGWLADRTERVPLMVIGLVATGVFGALPLVLTGPLAFVLLRAGAGLGAAIYDPAARGFLTDATPPDRRGEAFGLYGAAQMGGLLLGPSIGAFGAAQFGGIAFVFVFSAVAAVVAAVGIALRVREERYERHMHPTPSPDSTTFPPDSPFLEGRLAADLAADAARETTGDPSGRTGQAMRLLNRGLIAAIVINIGGYYAGGTYEVIWSLFMEGLGADLPLIGLTFAMFGLPILVFSPLAGRVVDRRGALAFIVIGSILPVVTGILYTFLSDPLLALPLILIEATGFAILNPALYAVVAASSPPGRSSTTQGLFGAAGTLGFIAASLAAGVLAERSILYPFYVFSALMTLSLVVGLAIGGRRLTGHTTGSSRA
ncbi:MAG: MFS transporter [Chloroflexi bacterium]|nr:MFS transporter [Chloroflexota bacterium]